MCDGLLHRDDTQLPGPRALNIAYSDEIGTIVRPILRWSLLIHWMTVDQEERGSTSSFVSLSLFLLQLARWPLSLSTLRRRIL